MCGAVFCFLIKINFGSPKKNNYNPTIGLHYEIPVSNMVQSARTEILPFQGKHARSSLTLIKFDGINKKFEISVH